MTDEEIDAMEAGRKMDGLVAEKVMGWVWLVIGSRPETGPPYRYLTTLEGFNPPPPQWDGKTDMPIVPGEYPHYSTDIAAAWLVVEKLIADDIYLSVEPYPKFTGGYRVGISSSSQELDYSTADTAPLAICRAALKCCNSVADKKEDAVKASVNS